MRQELKEEKLTKHHEDIEEADSGGDVYRKQRSMGPLGRREAALHGCTSISGFAPCIPRKAEIRDIG